MLNTFVWRESRVLAAVLALGLAVLAAAAVSSAWNQYSGFALAAVPIAGLAGWGLSGAARAAAGFRRTALIGLVWGVIVAPIAVLTFITWQTVAALLPGSTAARPETPLGYGIVLFLLFVGFTPLAGIPATGVGVVWALLVRWLGGGRGGSEAGSAPGAGGT